MLKLVLVLIVAAVLTMFVLNDLPGRYATTDFGFVLDTRTGAIKKIDPSKLGIPFNEY